MKSKYDFIKNYGRIIAGAFLYNERGFREKTKTSKNQD